MYCQGINWDTCNDRDSVCFQENQLYNCGPDVAVDVPSYVFAMSGRCRPLCKIPNVDLTCSFKARFGESLLETAPEIGRKRVISRY